MQLPTVSIVIPCFNAAKTIERAVESVFQDKYSNVEILIIDDGSSDNTYSIASKLAQMDRRIILETRSNQGVSATRNHGVVLSRGDFLAFLDADDYFIGDALSQRIDTLQENEAAGLIGTYCPAVAVDNNGDSLFEQAFFDYRLADNRLYYTTTFNSAFNPSCALIKRDKFLAASGFDEALTGGEDYDLWHRLMRTGDYFIKTEGCRIAWVQHAESAVRYDLLNHYQQCRLVYDRIVAELPKLELPGQDTAPPSPNQITHRIIGTAITAAVADDWESSAAIMADLEPQMLETLNASDLASSIRFSILRYLCQPEGRWPFVWQAVAPSVTTFFQQVTSSLLSQHLLFHNVITELQGFADKDNKE